MCPFKVEKHPRRFPMNKGMLMTLGLFVAGFVIAKQLEKRGII